ncbi:MAG TPA: hypothetical protein DIW26_10395 [Ruminococcus sp.]|nr:hypothetical protein [Ruminococcus sp.]HCR74741.1 hypothetical protein [Ruminococcus sp.]
MSIRKKIAVLLTSAAVLLSATGCGTGKNTSWAARYEDYEASAGIFIYYEMSAYYQAVNQAAGENENLDKTDVKALKATQIDGKDMLTWIQDEATDSLRKYLAVQAEFDNRGLELSEDEISEINSAVESSWNYYGSYYEQNGIGKESFKKITELSYKSAALFKSYYDEGGTDAVPKEDVEKYYDENYARVKYIAMELKDADGNSLDDDGKAEIKAMADDYVERANNGENFDDLIAEYSEYQAELTATDETDEIDVAETAIEEETVAVTEIAETNAENDLTEKDMTVSEAEAANSDNAEDVAADSNSDEEAVTTLEDAGTTEETAAETGDSSDEEAVTTAETAESSDETTENAYPNEQIIKKGSDDSYSPSEIVNKAIFNQTTYDEAFFIDDTDNSIYYVAVRYDLLAREDLLADDNLLTILNEMKGDDYNDELLKIVTIDDVTLNDSSYKRYDPFKFEL